MSSADKTCEDREKKTNSQIFFFLRILNPTLCHPLLTLSCLKKQSMRSSLKTLLQETRFWKTLGIFFRATFRPSRGSVTDLQDGDADVSLLKPSLN